jgi:hypothetical protein
MDISDPSLGKRGYFVRGPIDSYTRLLIFAVLFNAMLWAELRKTEPWSFFMVISYALGFVIGWLINPLFRPKRDLWAKSAYYRFSLRFLRAITIGGLIAFLSVVLFKAMNK